MDQSKTKTTSYRIFLSLLKGAMGLLVLTLISLILIHTPPIQKIITTKVSNYLTTTTNAEVVIERISFSIWGQIAIKGVKIDDPEGRPLLSANLIAVNPKLLTLFSENIGLDYIHIEGMNGILHESSNGLNINFFIETFNSDTPPVNHKGQ